MPRIPMFKIPLPVFKAKRDVLVHEMRRDDLLDKLHLKYPIYERLPHFWRKDYETPPPVINQNTNPGTKRPQLHGKWIRNEAGQPEQIEIVPLVVKYTKEVHAGLWGGEGLVIGLKYGRGKKENPKNPKNWRPGARVRTFYSEVLDRTIKTTVTSRTLQLIDDAYGFDHYILKTPVHELCSNFGASLKREMLEKLWNKDTEMYSEEAEKREKIFARYKKYLIPKEQVEWVGLTLREAMKKQWLLEKENGLHDPRPLLEVYTEQLKEQLLSEKQESSVDLPSDNITVFQAPKKSSNSS